MKTKILKLKEIKNKLKNCILGFGHFSTIHPGHIRYLQNAKKLGGTLVIALIGDIKEENNDNKFHFKQEERAEALSLLGIVDIVVLLEKDELKDAIKKLTPRILILGDEFQESIDKNIKESFLIQKRLGGEIKFHAGDIQYATTDLLSDKQSRIKTKRINQFIKSCNRQDIDKSDLLKSISTWQDTELLVIGDTIVDQYAACEALGMSAEAPIVVVKELNSKNFIGGAAVVASHIKNLGAKCHLLSIVGNDDVSGLVRDHLKLFGVGDLLITDNTRPTTFKKRYLVENQKLFRVSKLEDHFIDNEIENKVLKKIEDIAPIIKGIVISDFVYGVITPKILEGVKEIVKKYKLMIFGDLQCSSQVGDISKFRDFTLICPNEKEARFALQEKDIGLELLSQRLLKKTNCNSLIMKLGPNGFIVYEREEDDNVTTQAFPSLSVTPLDVTGAGDSLLALMATGLASGESIMKTAALGCCISALAVENMGNSPITCQQIKEKVISLF